MLTCAVCACTRCDMIRDTSRAQSRLRGRMQPPWRVRTKHGGMRTTPSRSSRFQSPGWNRFTGSRCTSLRRRPVLIVLCTISWASTDTAPIQHRYSTNRCPSLGRGDSRGHRRWLNPCVSDNTIIPASTRGSGLFLWGGVYAACVHCVNADMFRFATLATVLKLTASVATGPWYIDGTNWLVQTCTLSNPSLLLVQTCTLSNPSLFYRETVGWLVCHRFML